jgi:hypothetical protein
MQEEKFQTRKNSLRKIKGNHFIPLERGFFSQLKIFLFLSRFLVVPNTHKKKKKKKKRKKEKRKKKRKKAWQYF